MRSPMITRTLIGYIYSVISLDEECNIVKRSYKLNTLFNLDNSEERAKCLKALRKIDNSIAKVVKVDGINELYEMREDEFIARAEIVTPDNRRNKVTKTIIGYKYTVKTLDDDFNVMERTYKLNALFNLDNAEERAKCLKTLRKIDNSIAKVVKVEQFENIYGMNEDVFFAYAVYNPNGRATANKE